MKMIAPKISGEFMNEVCEGDWEYITNGLEINVFSLDENFDKDTEYRSIVKFNGNTINDPISCTVDSAQGAADQAVKFLHGLRNIINYINP